MKSSFFSSGPNWSNSCSFSVVAVHLLVERIAVSPPDRTDGYLPVSFPMSGMAFPSPDAIQFRHRPSPQVNVKETMSLLFELSRLQRQRGARWTTRRSRSPASRRPRARQVGQAEGDDAAGGGAADDGWWRSEGRLVALPRSATSSDLATSATARAAAVVADRLHAPGCTFLSASRFGQHVDARGEVDAELRAPQRLHRPPSPCNSPPRQAARERQRQARAPLPHRLRAVGRAGRRQLRPRDGGGEGAVVHRRNSNDFALDLVVAE